jgi:two-component system, OmpR family, response regulator
MSKDKSVLIIDDEEDLCLLLGAYLKRYVGNIQYAFDLESGLEKANSLPPDIIFLDNNLPDGTGLEAIPRFLATSVHVKIVMMSAMSHLDKKALQAGAIAFLEKPLSFRAVQELIH